MASQPRVESRASLRAPRSTPGAVSSADAQGGAAPGPTQTATFTTPSAPATPASGSAVSTASPGAGRGATASPRQSSRVRKSAS